MPNDAQKWIKFLRRYSSVSQNDNMYDEHISVPRAVLKSAR